LEIYFQIKFVLLGKNFNKKDVLKNLMSNNNSEYKLAIFDMDGTILNGRGIFTIAEKFGFDKKLKEYFKRKDIEYYKKSIEIAKLCKGYKKTDFLDVFRTIEYNEYLEKIIDEIKKRGMKTAIATDSYQFLADDIKKRLDFDYAFANDLITNSNYITGELVIHNKNLIPDYISGNIYSICKSDVLEKLCNKIGISEKESIAIGDGIVDSGMIKKAGLGVAYNAPDYVNKHADICINDYHDLLKEL